jgi:Uma2 family endonuclease
MAIRTRPWTRLELARLPDDGNRYELVRGELFVTPTPSPRHQQLIHRLAGLLRPFIEPTGIGVVDQAPSAVVFSGSEVQPDIIVRAEIRPLPETWDDMPTPVLAVEITSAITRRRDVGPKRELYVDAGIDEYWIVDPSSRSFRRIGVGVDELSTDSLIWQPIGASNPLVIDVAGYFRDALGC